MTLGEHIKRLRELKGVTQKQLADALGFSFQNVSKWENDLSTPDVDTLLGIAKYFSVSVDTLLGNAPDFETVTVKADVNVETDFSLWTDFEHMGTVAPDARMWEGRKRTGTALLSNCTYAWNWFQMGIDADGRICYIQMGSNSRHFKCNNRYYHRHNRAFDCILPENMDMSNYWDEKGFYEVCIPKGGYLLAGMYEDYRVRQILEHIIPKKLHRFIDPSNPRIRYGYDVTFGMHLLTDCISRGELDNISVTLQGDEITFTKPSEYMDPLSVNSEQMLSLVNEQVIEAFDRMSRELSEQVASIEEYVRSQKETQE